MSQGSCFPRAEGIPALIRPKHVRARLITGKAASEKTRLVRNLSAHWFLSAQWIEVQPQVSQTAIAGLPVGCEFSAAGKYIEIKSQIQAQLWGGRGHAGKSRDSL